MRHLDLAIIAFALAHATPAQAQQWTAGQQDVWDFEETCLGYVNAKETEKWVDCFHKDFTGWWVGEAKPTGKDEVVEYASRLEQEDVQWLGGQPIEIRVYGDFAFVQSLSTFLVSEPEGQRRATTAYTDILIRENGRWYYIADHGHTIPQDQE